jgi:SAM-dependent methyltransferase
MFRQSMPIPDDREFPGVFPRLDSWEFPHHLLTAERLARSLAPERIQAMARALETLGTPVDGVRILYAAPWYDATVVEHDSVDFVFSQAVLEHVDQIGSTYAALHQWLRPGGSMSHAIDFKSHGLTRDWYGHWTVPAWLWRIVRGRRSYLINRLPWSAHAAAIRSNGFRILVEERDERTPLPRQMAAREFESLSDDDRGSAGVYVLATKALAR